MLNLRESINGRFTHAQQDKEADEHQRLSNRRLCSLASVPRVATYWSYGDAQPSTPPHTDRPRLPDRLLGGKQGKLLMQGYRASLTVGERDSVELSNNETSIRL